MIQKNMLKHKVQMTVWMYYWINRLLETAEALACGYSRNASNQPKKLCLVSAFAQRSHGTFPESVGLPMGPWNRSTDQCRRKKFPPWNVSTASSHLKMGPKLPQFWKRESIRKHPFSGDMLVLGRVCHTWILWVCTILWNLTASLRSSLQGFLRISVEIYKESSEDHTKKKTK